MKKDWLDKKLEEKLKGFDLPLDLEAAWDSLEQNRKKDDKKKFLLSSISIVLVFAFLGIFFHQGYKEEGIASNAIELNFNSAELDKPKLAEKMPNERLIESGVGGDHSSSSSSSSSKPALRTTTELPVGSQSLIEVKNIERNKNPITSKFPVGHTISFETKKLRKRMEEQNRLPLILKQNNTEQKSQISNRIKTLPLQELAFAERQKELPLEKISEANARPQKNKKGITLSTLYGVANMNKKNQNLEEAAFKFIDEKEEAYDVLGTKLEYSHFLNNQFYIRAGLSYQLWSDRIQSQQSNPINVFEEDYPIEIREYNNGFRDTITQDLWIEKIEIATFDIWNKTHYVGLPISIGYQWDTKSKFGFDINGGINTNLLVKAEIHYLLADNNLESIKQEEFNSLLFQLEAGISTFYNFNQSLRLDLGIRSIFDINNRKTEEASFNSQYSSYNISLGLTKIF